MNCIAPFWRRLRRENRAVAYVEFAIALPAVLLVGLTGLELVNLVIAHLRVNSIAMMTADNAARVREVIDEANVIELFEGAKTSGASIDFAHHGRLILSSLEADPDRADQQWIRWQRCMGAKNANSSYGFPLTKEGAKITDATELLASDRQNGSPSPSAPDASTMTAMGPPGNQIAAPGGTAVMVVEAAYDYRPIISRAIFGDIEISYTSAFNVRQRADQDLRNGGRVPPARCDRYAA